VSGDPRCHWHGIGFVESDHGWSCPMCPRPTEIKRLRAEVRGFQAESGCWQRWHDAERALADQLAEAFNDVFALLPPDRVRLIRPTSHIAIAAYRTARTNGSAGATDVGGQP
jgi:hypothetical protein